jgi:thiosulfate/3-mercaptopyruvate sulfurtransferase
MKRRTSRIALAALLLGCVATLFVTHTIPPAIMAPARAQQKAASSDKPLMLIEPSELAKRLDDPKLRILDTRSKAEYAKGHIPGALWVDVASWQDLGKRQGGFRDAKAWGEKVGSLGVGRDSQVVVYGEALPNAGRIWWTLKYVGVPNVALLNGGWELWTNEDRPTATEVIEVARTDFEPRFDADRLEEIESLKSSLVTGKIKVVDTRSREEFTGADVRGKRGGHIPGAIHLEWKELLAKDGRFKTPEQLRELFRSRGILSDATAACY